MIQYPYLTDKAFLKMMDELPVKTQYVKVTLLNWNEDELQDIQGKIISGNLNLDGTSSMRRTCTLTMFVENGELNYNDINKLISINKKMKLFIGYKNTTNYYTDFPIIWFPLGLFIIISPSISHNTSGTTVSLQLKDKMCLLNGDVGGVLPAAVTLSEMDDIDENGNAIIKKPTIYQIIMELVNHFGNEQLGKIIISDLDLRIKQVMKWTGSSTIYIGYQQDSTGTKQWYINTDSAGIPNAVAYETGRDIGYIYTDFVYPGELIGDAGQTICNILDEIKSVLTNFEYFYDVDGNFIFQEIKNYLNTTQAKLDLNNINSSDYLVDIGRGKKVYSFDNSNIITSYSNNPQFNMIKNDFIVWGVRKTISDQEFPIRYHLAIDNKPKIGNTYNVTSYEDEDGLTQYKVNPSGNDLFITTTDWRTELYLQGTIADPLGRDSNYYYTELKNEWPKQYDIPNGHFTDETLALPYEMDFFLDFIDTDSAVGQFSVDNIGRRTKVLVDDKINCVFEPEIPDLVLIEIGSKTQAEEIQECMAKGQEYVQVPSDIYAYIAFGGTFNSAYNTIRDLLYQYTSYNESVTIQSLPIYYLEPNTRIGIQDNDSNIYGDFMIKTISLPLDIQGTMSISANKVLAKI